MGILTQALAGCNQLAQVGLEPESQCFGGYFYLVGGRHLVEHSAELEQLLRVLSELLEEEARLWSVAQKTLALDLLQQLQLAALAVQFVALLDDR